MNRRDRVAMPLLGVAALTGVLVVAWLALLHHLAPTGDTTSVVLSAPPSAQPSVERSEPAPQTAGAESVTDPLAFVGELAATLVAGLAGGRQQDREASLVAVLAHAEPGLPETGRQALIDSLDALPALPTASRAEQVHRLPGDPFTDGHLIAAVFLPPGVSAGDAALCLRFTVRCSPTCGLAAIDRQT